MKSRTTDIKIGDLVTIHKFLWNVTHPSNTNGLEVALVIDVKDYLYAFDESFVEHYFEVAQEPKSHSLGKSDLLVMFANDCKTMWVSSSKARKIEKN
jgi:hypothetical protein